MTVLVKSTEIPIIYCKDNIIYEVSKEFINLTGYPEEQLIGNSIRELSILLKIDSQVYLDNIETKARCFMFTMDNESREIDISCQSLDSENKKVYIIEEKPNSRIEDELSYVSKILKDNEEGVAIFSYHHAILLKANKKYMDYYSIIYGNTDSNVGKLPSSNSLFENVIKTGDSYYGKEVELISQNGNSTYWNLSLIPVCIDKKSKYLVLRTYDATEKVNNRNLLKNKNKELEIILDNISDQLIYVNKNKEYTFMNKATKANSLHDYSTLVNNRVAYGQAKYFDIKGNLIKYENTPVNRVLRGEKIEGYTLVSTNENGTTYEEVTGSPIYDKSGSITGGIMVYHDVTARLKMEEYSLLERTTKHLEINYASLTYPDFKIAYINDRGFNSIKKVNPDMHIEFLSSILGGNFFEFYGLNMDEAADLILNIKNSIELESSSYYHTKKFNEEGKDIYYKTMFQPIIGPGSQVKKVIAVAIDITKEEEAKYQVEKTLKIQEEILVNTSHELKTPLNVIFSSSQLLDLYLEVDSINDYKKEIINSNNIVKQNCYRLTKLINNIIDISKLESGYFNLHLTNRNIVQVIENLVQSVSDYIVKNRLSIIFNTNVEEKIIACDLFKIERIILNLISNAIKFSNPDEIIFVNILDKGSSVEISVMDTGIGIGKEDLDIIFEKFMQVDKSLTRKSEGTGIGLSLVKSLVELHGGTISVESTLGEGSIFKIELPSITVDNPSIIEQSMNYNERIEMIKLELSDIYQK